MIHRGTRVYRRIELSGFILIAVCFVRTRFPKTNYYGRVRMINHYVVIVETINTYTYTHTRSLCSAPVILSRVRVYNTLHV